MPASQRRTKLPLCSSTRSRRRDAIGRLRKPRPALAPGARSWRPALDYMREGDTLVVWKLDRLARSLSQLIETVATLRDRGIELRSLHENIDTGSTAGRLTFHLFASLAEFERDLIRDRTKAGLDAARARGRKGGRPRRLSDADIDTARKLLESDPPRAVFRGSTFALRSGLPPYTITFQQIAGEDRLNQSPMSQSYHLLARRFSITYILFHTRDYMKHEIGHY